MPLGQVVLGDFRRKKKRFGPSDVDNSDKLLVKRFMKDDTQAFDMLVIKHQQAIAHVVAIHIHDTAKDVVQDTFIKAYKGLT